ncbi:hypothetical protein D3C81_1925410 [compost metagenome]
MSGGMGVQDGVGGKSQKKRRRNLAYLTPSRGRQPRNRPENPAAGAVFARAIAPPRRSDWRGAGMHNPTTVLAGVDVG